MYEEHPVFKSPGEKAKLWRYMNFTKFVSLLYTEKLYFSRIDKFDGDNWEGTMPKHQFNKIKVVNELVREKAIAHYTKLLKDVQQKGQNSRIEPIKKMIDLYNNNPSIKDNLFRFNRYLCAINCWSRNTHESAALWKIYTISHESIAISTTFNNLVQAFPEVKYPVYIGLVKYLDYDKDEIQLDNIFRPMMCKRKSFSYENEIRILVSKLDYYGDVIRGKYNSAWGEGGDYIPVDIGKLVKSVHISPGASNWFVDLVKETVNKSNFGINVKQSKLDEEALY